MTTGNYTEWIVTIPLGRTDQAAYVGRTSVVVRASGLDHARTRGAAQLGVAAGKVVVAPNPGPDGTGDIKLIPGPYG